MVDLKTTHDENSLFQLVGSDSSRLGMPPVSPSPHPTSGDFYRHITGINVA